MKILFVCRYNRFRSKVAEAIFNKLNKNKKIVAESGGIIMDNIRPYIESNVVNIMNEKGYNIKGKPRQITSKNVKDFDMLLIVADNLSPDFFHDFNGKIIWWKIKDCDASDKDKIREVVNDIEENVEQLVNHLKKHQD